MSENLTQSEVADALVNISNGCEMVIDQLEAGGHIGESRLCEMLQGIRDNIAVVAGEINQWELV
ncbi:hypothetical protein [Pseudoalteromonas rubra]|uniref:hypothetical protein n=1 Tax=Pseudoalteromonas rubra TaxID=43658 RepID=UPI002DBEAB41|nr:hypothetical protein [Pseudoalteromonas rubra]MEC4091139.1 hypothetical protein [Pseudoalteromonas rubra]